MLQTQTVEPNTLSLLKRLMQIQALEHFSLVGGTALALKYGHRISIDIDLFSNTDFDTNSLIEILQKEFQDSFSYRMNNPSVGIFGYIENIKVDLVKYPHKQIRATELNEGIRMYHPADIIAMKVQAILNRAKKKDYWDIAELLKHYSIQEFCDFHKSKFDTQQLLIAIPNALIYFEDAEEDEDPISLKSQTWESIKSEIKMKVNEYLI